MKLKNRGMTAIDLVYFAIMLIVCVAVFESFSTSAGNVATNTAATAARKNVSLNTEAGFQILSSGPTIIAAVVILGIVGYLMMRK